MRRVLCAAAVIAAIAIGVGHSVPLDARAQAPLLSGKVSSVEEGAMEGVLVTVRREGAPFTVTVVSDARGMFRYPDDALAPGKYTVTMRAVGYELAPTTATVAAGKAATLDLKLTKARDVASQLTSNEWIISMPGTPEQKKLLVRRPANCVFCHQFDRIAKTRYTAEQWIPVIDRMSTYNPDYTGLLRHQKNPRPANAPAQSPEQVQVNPVTKGLAEYLATVNLGSGETWSYKFQTLPRPKGRATRVVITQFDLPRKASSVHDIDVDAQGNVWYGDSGFDYVGRLDPKTATFQEFKAPNALPAPPGIEGVLDVQMDKAGGLWSVVWGASFARLDSKTGQWRSYEMPAGTRLNFVAPFHGRDTDIVWANAVRNVYRVNMKTGKVETFESPFAGVPGSHAIYMVDRDSKDNAWFMDFFGSNIGRIDAVTGEQKLFPTPTKDAFPRRGYIDAQDRLWFGEFYADKIGMLDTKTGQFQEFPVNRQYIAPYYARPAKNGDVWTSTQGSDRLLRLDPKSGEIAEYLMPGYYDARKVVVDDSGPRTTVWLPNKNTGQLIRVQPLD